MNPQELQFELMKAATFNDYDGERVVADLKAHPNLWRGVIMGREGLALRKLVPEPQYAMQTIDLICLRDLPHGYWNVDTVFILTTPEHVDGLTALAREWRADEIHWLTDEEKLGSQLGVYPPTGHAVLRLWWD